MISATTLGQPLAPDPTLISRSSTVELKQTSCYSTASSSASPCSSAVSPTSTSPSPCSFLRWSCSLLLLLDIDIVVASLRWLEMLRECWYVQLGNVWGLLLVLRSVMSTSATQTLDMSAIVPQSRSRSGHDFLKCDRETSSEAMAYSCVTKSGR